MNESDIFTLRWNDFANNVSESFATLRKEEDFFDVTLVSEDLIQLSAHKVVLSNCSPVFKALIKSNSHPHPVLFLRGVGIRGLEYVLDFIYSGQVEIFQNHLNDFLELGQDLKLKGIINESFVDGKKDTEQNIIKSADENTSGPITENVLTTFKNEAADYSLAYNTDYNDKDEDFESTINGMIEKVGTMWHCKVCGKEYIPKNKSSLKHHVETKHVTGFTHTCVICQKILSTKASLQNHKVVYHKKMPYNM